MDEQRFFADVKELCKLLNKDFNLCQEYLPQIVVNMYLNGTFWKSGSCHSKYLNRICTFFCLTMDIGTELP